MKRDVKVKTLIYDIETLPVRAYVWRTGKQYVNHGQIKEGDFIKIICIGYRWEHEKTTKVLIWDNKKQNCDRLIDDFTKLVEQADIVLAHNGDRFDMKHVNTQRLLQGKAPISWPTSEDTLKQLRKQFALPSYSLDYVSKILFGSGKSPMAFQDWIDILEHKSEKALNKMVKYCKRDVDLLFKAYKRVKPYCDPRVGRHLLTGGDCPSCGSSKTTGKGKITLRRGTYRRFKCSDCAHVFRDGKKL